MKSKSSKGKSPARAGSSGRDAKRLPADPRVILKRLARLPIHTWSYKRDDPRMRHIGPMAQDFTAVFGVGDHHGINLADALGVAYASIQALNEMLLERAAAIRSLRRELKKIQSRLSKPKPLS
jgi:hypothetical protein